MNNPQPEIYEGITKQELNELIAESKLRGNCITNTLRGIYYLSPFGKWFNRPAYDFAWKLQNHLI